MPSLNLTPKDPARLDVDALVVGVARRPGASPTAAPAVTVLGADALPAALVSRLTAQAAALGVTGDADAVHRIPAGDDVAASVIALVGVGEAEEPDAETLRRAAGAATRQLTGVATVGLALPAADAAQVAAVAEGALLGAYAFERYRTLPAAQRPATTVELVTPRARDAAVKAAVARAEVVARAVHGVRDLVNASPLDLYPAAFADEAKAAAKSTKVKVTVLDEKQLAAGGYGGLVAVGQGSARPPRLVKVVWSPSRATRSTPSVALVGKGITFDSGGLSIKPAKGMEAMKSDMAGAAAVLHTVLAAAALELPVKVTGWLCLAENMPSGTAQRPSDVIVQRGGTTVEVLNTDAEGRLVLADGLVAACEEKPDAVLDVATLTGAQVVALGTRVSAVMGTDDVRGEVVRAAEAAGEQFWPMPLPVELRASLKSPVADLANIGDRMGGMLVAGLFLKEFVGSTPWAHLDIAGPAFNEGQPHDYTPVGGTGVAVRTLLALLEQRAGA